MPSMPSAGISSTKTAGQFLFTRREIYLLTVLFAAGILLRAARLAEIAQYPEWIVPDKDQVDMAFFYNYGQDLANKFRDFLGMPHPEPNPLPPSPVNWTQSPDEGFMRPPAYSVFLGGIFLLSGNSLLAPIIVQSILGVLSAFLAWRLARQIGGRAPALPTAAFMLFYWVLLVYEGVYHALTLMVFLALLLVNALEYWSRRPSLLRAALVGCCITLNMLAAPSSALFAPVAALWMWLWLRSQVGSWKKSLPVMLRQVSVTAICSALLVSPSAWSNFKATGQLALVAPGLGSMLLIGNHDGANGYYHDPQKAIIGIEDTGDSKTNSRIILEKTGKNIPPVRMSSESGKLAVQWIRAHPGEFLRLTLKRAVIFWQPKEISHNVQEYCAKQMSRILRWLPGGFPEILGGVGAAVVMGLFLWRATPWPVRLRWLLPALYSLVWYLPFTVFYYAGHYRVPILPFLAMLAAGGLWSAITSLRKHPATAGMALCFACALWLGTRLIPVDYESDWERWFYYKPEAVRRFRGESGLKHLESLVESTDLSRSPSACLFMAQRKMERKDFSAAIEWCQRGLGRENLSTERRVWLLEFLMGTLQAGGATSEEVDRAVQELLRHDPDNFLARMYRANQAMRATDYQAAVDELNIALRTKPENGNAWFLLGQCRVAMGFPELAESAYRKGLEMDPNDPWPAMGLAGVLETQGRLEEARQAVQEALRRAPNLRAAQEKLKNWGD